MALSSKAQAVLGNTRRALLGLWFGSVACFSFLVAPTLFRVLRNAPPDRVTPAPNALAGDVVVPTLQKLAWMGLVVGILVGASLLWDKGPRWQIRLGAVALGVLSVLVSMLWLTPTMLDLLAQMGTAIDLLPEDNALRVSFNSLHKYSSTIHSGMLLGSLVALCLEKPA
ncbi:MAG: DUF4149 domain-containing protein [Myxococcota bacterium]